MSSERDDRPAAASGKVSDAIGAISRQGFLGGLSETLRNSLLEGAHLIEYPPGSSTSGKPDSRLSAVVVSGLVRTYLSAPDGRQITLHYSGASDLVSPGAGSARNLGDAVQAVEQSSLLHLDPLRLERLAGTDPELSWALARGIEERLSHAHQMVAMCTFARVRTRVARDLLERALALGSPAPGTPLRTTHQELADAIGSVREVVARAIRDLRAAGVIERHPNGVTIADLDRLLLAAEIHD